MNPFNRRKRIVLGIAMLGLMVAARTMLAQDGYRFGLIGFLFLLWMYLDSTLSTAPFLSKPKPQPIESKFWLQGADGNIVAITDETQEGIMAAVKTFDWANELEKQRTLGKRSSVPPGLGLGNFGDNFFVHVTMFRPEEMDVLIFHRKAKNADYKQILGQQFPFSDIDKVVKAYLAYDTNGIAEIIRSDQRF